MKSRLCMLSILMVATACGPEAAPGAGASVAVETEKSLQEAKTDAEQMEELLRSDSARFERVVEAARFPSVQLLEGDGNRCIVLASDSQAELVQVDGPMGGMFLVNLRKLHSEELTHGWRPCDRAGETASRIVTAGVYITLNGDVVPLLH